MSYRKQPALRCHDTAESRFRGALQRITTELQRLHSIHTDHLYFLLAACWMKMRWMEIKEARVSRRGEERGRGGMEGTKGRGSWVPMEVFRSRRHKSLYRLAPPPLFVFDALYGISVCSASSE